MWQEQQRAGCDMCTFQSVTTGSIRRLAWHWHEWRGKQPAAFMCIVTMDAIARSAGISKKTLYQLVASKEELMSQLVARDLSTLELLLESGIDCAEDLLSELRMYLYLWARLTLSPLALGIYLMAAQGRESAPGIARIWYQEGAQRCLNLLRGWLGKAAGKGLLARADVEPAVELIDALLISQPLKLFTLGVQQSWSDEQISERVEVALGMFGRCFMARGAVA